MYRDDDAARGERANVLIDEIAKLERAKVEAVAADQRLEAARDELRTLQAAATETPASPPLERHRARHDISSSRDAGARTRLTLFSLTSEMC